MDIIDNDKKMKHAKLAEGVENAIQVLYLIGFFYYAGIWVSIRDYWISVQY